MSREDLPGPLLASVSRSFYLTIRLLPAKLQEPIALAYLLARASDTIADSATAEASLRLRHLDAFASMLRKGGDAGLEELQRDIRSEHSGESALIANLGRCLSWLAEVGEFDRAEIRSVMEKIIRGQSLDLQRFAQSDRIVALETALELDEYTYLVAGCVGEFWTRICLHHQPRCAALPEAEMCRLGVNYGKGLQLVNILRDLPADLRSGRCYLPAEELRAAGVDPATLLASPSPARPVVQRWLAQAAAQLDNGERYIAALRPARLRVGCFLPWYLGRKTLALLREHSPLEVAAKLKVPRSTVRTALALAPAVALSNWPLRWLGAEGRAPARP